MYAPIHSSKVFERVAEQIEKRILDGNRLDAGNAAGGLCLLTPPPVTGAFFGQPYCADRAARKDLNRKGRP